MWWGGGNWTKGAEVDLIFHLNSPPPPWDSLLDAESLWQELAPERNFCHQQQPCGELESTGCHGPTKPSTLFQHCVQGLVKSDCGKWHLFCDPRWQLFLDDNSAQHEGSPLALIQPSTFRLWVWQQCISPLFSGNKSSSLHRLSANELSCFWGTSYFPWWASVMEGKKKQVQKVVWDIFPVVCPSSFWACRLAALWHAYILFHCVYVPEISTDLGEKYAAHYVTWASHSSTSKPPLLFWLEVHDHGNKGKVTSWKSPPLRSL